MVATQDIRETESPRQAPRLALARAVALGMLPIELLGPDAYEALQDAERADRRIPANAD